MNFEPIDYKKVGDRVRTLREAAGMDQKELAGKIAVSQAFLSYFENGLKKPETETLSRLAQFFDTTLDELVYGKK